MLTEIGKDVDPRFSHSTPRLSKTAFGMLCKPLATLRRASLEQILERIDPVMTSFKQGLRPDHSNTLEPSQAQAKSPKPGKPARPATRSSDEGIRLRPRLASSTAKK